MVVVTLQSMNVDDFGVLGASRFSTCMLIKPLFSRHSMLCTLMLPPSASGVLQKTHQVCLVTHSISRDSLVLALGSSSDGAIAA
jgi:hypothetical protein